MIALLLSPKAWLGLGLGLLVAGGWAVLFHGPAQYEAGSTSTAARLDAATNAAIGDLSNEADRARFVRRQCRELGGVYDLVTGRCVEGEAE